MKRVRLLACLVSLVPAASALAADPFQSAPVAAPAPAPRPAPRPREPEPAPVVAVPPPAPPAPFDGFWTGRYSCDEKRNMPAFQKPLTAQVKGNQFTLISELSPGAPGYWSGTATIGADGSFLLAFQGVGSGVPGTQYSRGQPFSRRLRGRFNGGQMQAADLDTGDRSCGLTMTRRE